MTNEEAVRELVVTLDQDAAVMAAHALRLQQIHDRALQRAQSRPADPDPPESPSPPASP